LDQGITGKGTVEIANGSNDPASSNVSNHEHEFEAISEWLGDSPITVISLHFLREGRAEVFCVGSPHDPDGVVIQPLEYPEEPTAFGQADAIASILPMLSGWTCINVPADVADALVEPVRDVASARSVRLLDDVYHELSEPVRDVRRPDVRLLTPGDRDLLRAAPVELVGDRADSLIEVMTWGHVTGAIRDGRIVSIAHTFARSERHVDIGVATLDAWRRQGLATAAAAQVAGAIQSDGKIPVWSCGGQNTASLAVAAKLGFREIARRTYLVPDLEGEQRG
jgi:GNAT superfamily N-acetyltransferase